MNEQEFDYMWDAVNEICRSLEEEPHKWIFETYTFKKKWCRTEYWIGFGTSFTEIWNGRTTSRAFSHEQGKKIFKSYNMARQSQADAAQKSIIEEVLAKPQPLEEKACRPWWKFWSKA